MNFSEFICRHKNCYVLEEGFALWKINSSSGPDYCFDLNGMHAILLVLDGEMTVRIDDTPYLLRRNCFVDTIEKQTLELSGPFQQVQAWQLLLTERYFSGNRTKKNTFQPVYKITSGTYL